MPVIMVRTRVHHIWKLHASDQPSGRPFPWPGRAKPGMEITCSGSATVRKWLKTGKNFSEIFGKPIAQLSVRTAYDYRPDNA